MRIKFEGRVISKNVKTRDQCLAFIQAYCEQKGLSFNHMHTMFIGEIEVITCGGHEFVISKDV